MEPEVAPDGSPVPVYRALPAEPEFTPVLDFLVPPGSVLDLGCGAGRLANELAARGFDVTGVDESPQMLAHLRPGVERVRERLETLHLGRRFDAVVLASHFVNVAEARSRRAFLRAAAEHVAPGGTVLVQHWEVPPDMPRDANSRVGEVRVSFRVLQLDGRDLHGRVTYALGECTWVQTFRARLLDDGELDAELARAGLRRLRRMSPRWLAAEARGP